MDHEGFDRLEIAGLVRTLYRYALPGGAALALASWLLLRPAPSTEALPAVALLLILLSALHALSDIPRRTLHTFLYLGLGGFLMLEAAPHLLGSGGGALARAVLWVPLLSAIALLLFGRALGRWLAALPPAALLTLWAVGRPESGGAETLALLLQVAGASALAALLVDRAAAHDDREADVFATEDVLTGLLDEPTLTQRLERKASDPETRFALILLVIDNFSYLSNEIGADGTDGVLRAVADFLENGVREAETVARWTPDSFLILVGDTGASEAATLAERLRRGMMRVPVSGLPRLTVSIGAAVRGEGEGVADLVARVEKSAELAKRGGGDQVMLDAGGG